MKSEMNPQSQLLRPEFCSASKGNPGRSTNPKQATWFPSPRNLASKVAPKVTCKLACRKYLNGFYLFPSVCPLWAWVQRHQQSDLLSWAPLALKARSNAPLVRLATRRGDGLTFPGLVRWGANTGKQRGDLRGLVLYFAAEMMLLHCLKSSHSETDGPKILPSQSGPSGFGGPKNTSADMCGKPFLWVHVQSFFDQPFPLVFVAVERRSTEVGKPGRSRRVRVPNSRKRPSDEERKMEAKWQ